MKKLFQKYITNRPRSFILTLLALFAAGNASAQQITTVLPTNSSTSNKTAPQGALRYQRGFYLITPAEMSQSGLGSSAIINSIGFKMGRASNDTAHGQFKVYLQNTNDLVSRADTTWNEYTVTGNHYDANLLFPGDYEWQVKANCTNSSSFTPVVYFSNAGLEGCTAPYNLSSSAITTNSATLVWESANAPGTATFLVEYTALDVVNWISAPVTSDTFYLVSGLLPGKSYQWRVKSTCSAVISAVNQSSFTTNTISNCLAPTGLTTAVRLDSIVRLSWDSMADALYYQVQFRRAGTESWSTSSSFTDSSVLVLPLGTTYEWRVRTVCGADSTGNFTAGPNFTMGGATVCYQPTNTVTRQISDNFAELSWNDVVGVTNYTVRIRAKNTISWDHAINPSPNPSMSLVCDSTIILKDTSGVYDIPFHGAPAFTYTGAGLYVAWEFSRPSGTLTSPGLIMSTTEGTRILGVNGEDSVKNLLCMISKADTNLLALPTTLGESRERPETRFGSPVLKDSLAVVSVFALGNYAPRFQTSAVVSALITNYSVDPTNADVTLTVREKKSGALRYSAFQSVPVTGTDTVLVSFTGWSPTVNETDSIIVSIAAKPGENVLANNSKVYLQQVNPTYISYDDGSTTTGSAGRDSIAGLTLAKLHIDGCGRVVSAKVFLSGSAQGHPLTAVIRNAAGAIIASSPDFTPGEGDVNRYHSFYFTAPPSFQNEDLYIGIKQSASAPGNFPVGVQWEEAEARAGAYYHADEDGTNLTDHPQQGRLMILAEVVASSEEPFIDGNLILCTGATNVLTAGSTNTRFANSVVSFSSQYANSNYSASQVLGSPNVYPLYALSPNSWMSATSDGQREYLELGFPAAAPINFVDIYETANAGAVDSIFTFNGTGYDLVYSTTAAEKPQVARKNRISFPLTAYPVSQIRIAINSPLVPGNNAIDAVGIGKKELPATGFTYLWTPGGETTATKSVSVPGNYVLTVTNTNGCQFKDSVNIVAAITTAPVITGASSFCPGDSVILTSSIDYHNTWSTGDTTKSIVVLTAGTFTVTYDDGAGCGGLTSAPFTTTINPLPTVSITGNLSICPGGSTSLDAGGGFTKYFWNTGDTTQTITANFEGTYNVTVTNANGCRNTASANVTYATLAPPTITGNLSFCPGGSTTLDAGNYSTYLWSNGATSQTITVTTADQFEVTVTNSGGCSATNSVATSIYTPPSPTISGANGFCSGGSVSLTANTGYNAYAWSTGAITENIFVNTAGSYTVTVTDINGCTGSRSKTIELFASPSPAISGTLSFCGGTTTTLNAGTGYSSYVWSTGATTQTIVVGTVGTFSVTVTNANGCSATASATTTNTGTLPATPGPITGPAISSCNTVAVYSITAVANASHYVWTVPTGATITSGQGTISITVSFGAGFQGGYLVVAASNACGQSASLTPRKLYIQALAGMPGAITGPSAPVCGPTVKSYSIASVPLATSYTWTAPAGATVTSGQGTTSVQISFTTGFSSGNVSVTANNACGSSLPSRLMVTGIPPIPGAISGPTIVCKTQSNVIYSVDPAVGATSYTWTVPQAAQISAGAGTNTIVVKFGSNGGNVTVKANSSCGSSAVRSLPVTVITCGNGVQTQNYTITEIRPVPEVVSSYGGSGTAKNMVFEWTLGEPRIDLVNKDVLFYTQGFHQPLIYLSPSKGDTVILQGIRVVAFPNPVSSVLNVKIESIRAYRSLTVEITDLNGRILQKRQVSTGKSDYFTLQMGSYIAGSYLLVVRDISGRIITTVKIEKPGYSYLN